MADYLVNRVENTPFAVLKREDEKFVIVFGRNQVVEHAFDTLEDAINYIQPTSWDLYTNTMWAICSDYNELNNNVKKSKK